MDDELQEVRDNFYVGNFAKVVQLCEKGTSNDITQIENDAIAARAALALNQMDKIKILQNSENPGQKATAVFAVMHKTTKEEVKAKAKEGLLKLAKETQDVTSAMLAAIATANDGEYADAVKMAKAHPTLEMQALCIFFALICNQVGMAEKMLNEMAGQNDDSACYRLALAAVKLATGDPEEAYLTYCDLSGQYPPADGEDGGFGSVMLQTGKAVANMQRGMFNEAVDDLQHAHSVDSTNADVLVNLCCCMTNLQKKEEFDEYYAKLVQVAPTHPFVVKSQGMSQVFARFKASIKA